MKKTHIFLTLLAVALATGLLFISCDTATTASTSTTSGPDSALNGTWFNEESGDVYNFNNGSFEMSFDGNPVRKGTYTTSGNNITVQVTHLHGGNTDPEMALESKWYTKAELKASGKIIDELLDLEFAPHPGTYSINGNTLIWTLEGYGTSNYTKI